MENIKEYIDKSLNITICRDEIDDDIISAIPLKICNDLLLIVYLYDFNMDGYKVLHTKEFTEIQHNGIDEFHDFIISRQKILENVDRLDDLDVSSWKNVFCYLKNNDIMLDISLEKIEKKKNFFVGKIYEIYDDYILLKEVNVFGIFKEKKKKIYYNDITMVSFKNRYSEMLDKYGYEFQNK